MRKLLPLSFFFIVAIVLFFSCQKESVVKQDNFTLSFSTDTVYFDTVLATMGTVTQHFRIKNTSNEAVEINEIALARGSNSYFRLNLDGQPGNQFNRVKIPAKDSLYLFVEAYIDPLNENSPLLIKDSILFSTSTGVHQDVKLIAYGQDVILFENEYIESQTWTGEKPILIRNSAAVDSNEVLFIEPGTQVYLTSGSSLIILGRLEAIGSYEEPIVFTGARFDGRNQEAAGQWERIMFGEYSQGNIMEHVIVQNSTAGVQIGLPSEETQASLEMRNCMVLNTASVAIYAFNASLNAYNTVVADCGNIAVLLQMGGSYNFYHCTVSNINAFYPNTSYYEGYYKQKSHFPSVTFTNFFRWYDFDQDYRVIDVNFPFDLNVNFVNSIIDGTLDSELRFLSIPDADLTYSFQNCLIKITSDSLKSFDTLKFTNSIFNEDPAFINDSIKLGEYNFELDSNSAAINAGSLSLIEGINQLDTDFKGTPRKNDGQPDLGAFERTP